MTAVKAIVEAGYEFRKIQPYWDDAPDAVEMPKDVAQQLEKELRRGPDTQWAPSAFDKHGTEYLLGSKIYGMEIMSISAPAIRAFKNNARTTNTSIPNRPDEL